VVAGYRKEELPKNLPANCRSTAGQQITDRLPTSYRQLSDSYQQRRKFVLKTRTFNKHDLEMIIIVMNITYLGMDGKRISF